MYGTISSKWQTNKKRIEWWNQMWFISSSFTFFWFTLFILVIICSKIFLLLFRIKFQLHFFTTKAFIFIFQRFSFYIFSYTWWFTNYVRFMCFRCERIRDKMGEKRKLYHQIRNQRTFSHRTHLNRTWVFYRFQSPCFVYIFFNYSDSYSSLINQFVVDMYSFLVYIYSFTSFSNVSGIVLDLVGQ